MRYFLGHRQIKGKEFKNQKNPKAKKTSNNTGANNNSSNDDQLSDQLGQNKSTSGQLSKNDFCHYFKTD